MGGGEDFDPEEGPPPLEQLGNVQDLRADCRIFQYAGIGFGEQETYRL